MSWLRAAGWAACCAVLTLTAEPAAAAAAAAQKKAHVAKVGSKSNKASAKAGTTRKAKGKARGPTVIHMPSPPAATLAPLKAAAVRSGCLGSAAELQTGYTQTQLQSWFGSAGTDSAACRRYAAVAFASQTGPQGSAALFADVGTRALLVTQRDPSAEPSTLWVELDPEVSGMRELWLPSVLVPGRLDEIPASLQNELLLLVALMKKQSGASDTTMLRVWLQGDDEEASLQAVELVDPHSGRAIESVVWLARQDAPGAYISSSGIEYERMLWQSPVRHLRISRGIGASSMLVNKRTVVKTRARGKIRARVVIRTFRYQSQHVGIDFAAPTGTPVVAVADGDVVFAGWRGGYGQLVLLQHGDEFSTYYGHLSALGTGIENGLHVRRGQVIGLVGSTGFSTGPHLHYEIRKSERYVDPTRADVQLPFWMVNPEEHPTLLARLLQLELTRERSMLLLPQPTS